jgi:hypothetical protein
MTGRGRPVNRLTFKWLNGLGRFHTSPLSPKPESKKFAVKVINHYGDGVLRVISV